jgi:hypothetical protein
VCEKGFLCFSIFLVGDGGGVDARMFASLLCFVLSWLGASSSVFLRFLSRYFAMDEPIAEASCWKERAVTLCSVDCFLAGLVSPVFFCFSALLIAFAAESRRVRRGDFFVR